MKCPKCGAFIEEGRTVCFMCGENLANRQDPNNMGQTAQNDIINSTLAESLNTSIGGNAVSSSNSYAGFGGASGMPSNENAFGTGGFSTGAQPSAPMQHTDFNSLPKPDMDPNAYKNAEVKLLKNEDEDVFDFYARHKGVIRFFLIIGLVALVGFIGYKVYES